MAPFNQVAATAQQVRIRHSVVGASGGPPNVIVADDADSGLTVR
jgi:hypothetical protein